MRIRVTAAVLAGVLSVGLNQPASATAIVDVTAFVAASVHAVGGGAVPDGFAVDCLGAGCSDTVHVLLSRTAPGETTLTKNESGRMTITNNTGADSELFILLSWSAFFNENKPNPEIGASVGDPILEFASFSSRVDITVPPNPLVGGHQSDEHSCETSVFAPSCGVPGANTEDVGFPVPLAAGSTAELDYLINVSGTVRVLPVPEPGTIALLGAGLMSLAAIRRRRP